MKILPLVLFTSSVLIAGCSRQAATSDPVQEEATPEASSVHGTTSLPQAPAAAAASPRGTVKETMDSGGYTYVLLDTGEEELWAVAPQFVVAVGDEVQVNGSMPMPGYHSNTLDRTFDMVYFAETITPPGAGAGMNLPAGHGAPAPKASADLDFTGIERAPGGATVEEVFLMKDELVDTEIAVRAKVVKYNGGIMGKNWLHVQDGTGADGTNDLAITTDATCAVGDTVLVRGKLVADRDFGAGYFYDLIVEDAQVTVE